MGVDHILELLHDRARRERVARERLDDPELEWGTGPLLKRVAALLALKDERRGCDYHTCPCLVKPPPGDRCKNLDRLLS